LLSSKSLNISNNPTAWKDSLITLEIAHNSRTQKHSPFELLYGYQPPFRISTHEESHYPEIKEKLKILNEYRHFALEAHEEAMLRMTSIVKKNWD